MPKPCQGWRRACTDATSPAGFALLHPDPNTLKNQADSASIETAVRHAPSVSHRLKCPGEAGDALRGSTTRQTEARLRASHPHPLGVLPLPGPRARQPASPRTVNSLTRSSPNCTHFAELKRLSRGEHPRSPVNAIRTTIRRAAFGDGCRRSVVEWLAVVVSIVTTPVTAGASQDALAPHFQHGLFTRSAAPTGSPHARASAHLKPARFDRGQMMIGERRRCGLSARARDLNRPSHIGDGCLHKTQPRVGKARVASCLPRLRPARFDWN